LELIPVIVLTTSDHDVDVHQAFENKANAYIQKPLGVEELIKVVQTIEGFQL
ncbi:MAG: chemotaxis family two-component system response regulator Rcp1, partial [Planctomycetota bacterium]